MFKVNNRNTRKRCQICSKLKVQSVLLLTLNIFTSCFSAFIVNFEQVIAGWVATFQKKLTCGFASPKYNNQLYHNQYQIVSNFTTSHC